MKALGNIDLQSNKLLNVVLDQVTNFPASPKVGQLIFKSQRVMICVELDEGLPVWAPLTAEINTHIHDQAAAASTWTIPHELNTSHVIAQVIDTSGKHIIPDEITCNYNETVITFAEAISGRAVLMLGSEQGSPRDNYSFEQEFSGTDTVVVNHMLGYNPVIRAFIGNQEVQPLTITHNDLNTTTVTFSTPQTGTIRCI